MLTIPKLIHQTWKVEKVPRRLYAPRWIRSWKEHHPDWEYRLWTDEDNRNLVKEFYPWFLPIFDNYPEAINRADAIRYFILHKYGGLYIDLDFQCLRSIEPLLNDARLVFGKMLSNADDINAIPNAFMASEKDHPFCPLVFEELKARGQLKGLPADVAGSRMLHPLIMSLYKSSCEQSGLKILEPESVFPINWFRENIHRGFYVPRTTAALRRKYPDAYAVTFWTHRWGPKLPCRPRLKNFIKTLASALRQREIW